MGALIDIVKDKFPDAVVDSHSGHGDETVSIRKDSLIEVMRFLRDDSRTSFNFLMDLTAVDYLDMGKTPRFEVVYHLYSLGHNHRLRIKAGVEEKDCNINSLVQIWIGADWYEREVWDLYGIVFEGHPNMKRLLLYEEFEGHPLRKDYPITKRQPLIGPDN
jgi:NADH-quinone oxidoreductase subunit C